MKQKLKKKSDKKIAFKVKWKNDVKGRRRTCLKVLDHFPDIILNYIQYDENPVDENDKNLDQESFCISVFVDKGKKKMESCFILPNCNSFFTFLNTMVCKCADITQTPVPKDLQNKKEKLLFEKEVFYDKVQH